MRSASLVTLALLCLGLALPAQDILDQDYDVSVGGNVSSGIGITNKSQVFTIGSSGVLGRIEVFVRSSNGSGNLILDILPTTAGIPDVFAHSLGTFSLTATEVGTVHNWVSIDVADAGIVVAPGDVLAIALRSSGGAFSWIGSSSIVYPGGGSFFQNPGVGITNWTSSGTFLAFRSYIMGPTAVSDDVPYFVDFEKGPTRWTVDNGLWELGTPAQANINQAFSGTNC